MSTTTQNEARKIRASLKHPVIDADGHWAEFPPLMRQEFKRIGGDRSLRRLGPPRVLPPTCGPRFGSGVS
jgi:hypothetical protein